MVVVEDFVLESPHLFRTCDVTGDRIHISDVNSQTDPNGSTGWVVENVSLFSTTMFWTATNECATVSNAAIANSRIINAARSPHAKLQVKMMFEFNSTNKQVTN